MDQNRRYKGTAMLYDGITAPGYSQPTFVPQVLRQMVRHTKTLIKRKFPGIQAIAARGNSGIPLASIVAYELGLHTILVRRDKFESRHNTCEINGYSGDGSYVIVDDLIDSGETVKDIIEKITLYNKQLKPAGIVLYLDDRERPFPHIHFGDIPVASTFKHVKAAVKQAELEALNHQTCALLMNATHIWRNAGGINVKLENGKIFHGGLSRIDSFALGLPIKDWIKRFVSQKSQVPFVLVSATKLHVLPSDISESEFEKLFKEHAALSYIYGWYKGYATAGQSSFEISDQVGLGFRNDLILAPPEPEAAEIEGSIKEEKPAEGGMIKVNLNIGIGMGTVTCNFPSAFYRATPISAIFAKDQQTTNDLPPVFTNASVVSPDSYKMEPPGPETMAKRTVGQDTSTPIDQKNKD